MEESNKSFRAIILKNIEEYDYKQSLQARLTQRSNSVEGSRNLPREKF